MQQSPTPLSRQASDNAQLPRGPDDMRGKRLLKLAAIVMTIGAVGGCGGAALVAPTTVQVSASPPTTTATDPTDSAQYCQRLPDGKWVTNDSAFSTTPCVPEPTYATGDERADGAVALPRCVTCSLSVWNRAEARAAARSGGQASMSGMESAAAEDASGVGLPEAAGGSLVEECAQDTDDGLCDCVTGQVAQEVAPGDVSDLTADDPRVQAAVRSCSQ